MKKTLLFLLTLFLSLAGYAEQYDWTPGTHVTNKGNTVFDTNEFSATNKSVVLGGKTWTIAAIAKNSYNTDSQAISSSRGWQFGTSSVEACPLTFECSDFLGEVTTVKINAAAGSNQYELQVKVNGVAYTESTSKSADPIKLASTQKEYTFTGSESGKIEICYTHNGSTKKAVYLRSISVTTAAGPVDFAFEGFMDYTLEAGETQALELPANAPAVAYSSSDATVANVEENTIKAIAKGTATITASWAANDTWNAGSKEFVVTVTAPKIVPNITAAQDTYTVDLADENHATTIANPFTIDVEGATMAYASNNTAVATVAADGTITIVGQKGSATITATYAGDAEHKPAEASVTVTVKDSNVKGFVKVESTADLTVGEYIIVTNPKSITEGYKAMSTTNGSSNISNVAVTVEDGVVAETENLLHIILFKEIVDENGQANTYWHLWGSDLTDPSYINGGSSNNNLYFNPYGTKALIEVENGVATIRYIGASNDYQILFQANNVNVFKNYKTSNLTGTSTQANYRTVSLYKNNNFVPVEVQKPIAEHDETAGTVTCKPADAQHRLWVRVETVMKDAAEPAAAAPTYPDMEESYWLPKENVEFTNVAPGKSYTVETPAAESNIAKVIVNARAYDVNGNLSGTMGEREITADGKITTSILDIDADANAPVEFYNLQGVRVSGNEPGLYIRRQGTNVTKVLVK